MGFSEHKISDSQPTITNQGQDRFVVLAEKIIEEYYSNKKN
jgi:hypothetical protein